MHAPTLASALATWWSDQRSSSGSLAAAQKLIAIGFEFLRDSLPDRRRQRFGDIDYDWECRVDTTSANVSWRARLIGLLNSAYQPIDPALFREIMNSLTVDFAKFTFVDIGSGKGRALLLALEYPFHRIVGIELLPELNWIAQDNLRRYFVQTSKTVAVEAICADATEFTFPKEPLVVLLNNPLPVNGLTKLINNLEQSVWQEPRPVIVIYANPVLEEVLDKNATLHKLCATQQYAIFENQA